MICTPLNYMKLMATMENMHSRILHANRVLMFVDISNLL